MGLRDDGQVYGRTGLSISLLAAAPTRIGAALTGETVSLRPGAEG
jgi:hypothetical protein